MGEFKMHCGNCDLEYYCHHKATVERGVCDKWRPDFYATEELNRLAETCETCGIQK